MAAAPVPGARHPVTICSVAVMCLTCPHKQRHRARRLPHLAARCIGCQARYGIPPHPHPTQFVELGHTTPRPRLTTRTGVTQMMYSTTNSWTFIHLQGKSTGKTAMEVASLCHDNT